MPDEAVIRIVMQGAAGAPSSAAAPQTGAGGGQAGQSLSDTYRQADILAVAIARELGKGRSSAGGGKKEETGVVGSVLKGIASIPQSLVSDYIESVKKTFTKSFIEGTGGASFGKELGGGFSKILVRQFSDKTGEQLGAEAAEATSNFANKFVNTIRRQFDKGPQAVTGSPGTNGPFGGYGSQGGSGSTAPPPLPPPAGLPIPFADEPLAPPKEQRGVWGPEAAARVKAARERKKAERQAAREAKRREDAVNKQMMMEDLQERQAIEKTQAGDTPLSNPEASGAAEGLTGFATGGKVTRSGAATVTVGETILPVAQGTDLSGPGKLSSDLDPITEALGLGKALKEVKEAVSDPDAWLKSMAEPVKSAAPTESKSPLQKLADELASKPKEVAPEIEQAANEVVYKLRSQAPVLFGHALDFGPVYHSSIGIGPEGEPPILPGGRLNPKFKAYGTSPQRAGAYEHEVNAETLESGDYTGAERVFDVEAEKVRKAMKEFDVPFNLLTANCKHATEAVLDTARGVDKLDKSFPIFGPAFAGVAGSEEAGGLAGSLGEAAGGLSAKGGKLAGRGFANVAPYAGRALVKGVRGALQAGTGFVKGVYEESPGMAVAGGAALGVGAAIMAAGMVKDLGKALLNSVVSIKSFASSSSSDPGAQLSKLGEGAASAAEKIPILGSYFAIAGDFVKDFGVIMQNLNQTAERYGEYSPQIAGAQAQAEITQTLGDMRRAQTIAPELTKFLQAQSDIQQKIEDTKIRLLMKLMPAITHMVEILEAIMPVAESTAEAVIIALAPLGVISSVARSMLNIQEDANKPLPHDPTDLLLNDRRFTQPGMGNKDNPGFVPTIRGE